MHQNAGSVHKDQRGSVICLLVCLIGVFEGLFVLTHALVGDCHVIEEVKVSLRAHLFCYFELFESLFVSVETEASLAIVGMSLKVFGVG